MQNLSPGRKKKKKFVVTYDTGISVNRSRLKLCRISAKQLSKYICTEKLIIIMFVK